ncbi:MAG: response regulator [Planctomycetota bacterium]
MAGKQILVVDDSQTVRVLVERILTSAGFDVVIARDGFEGLEKITSETKLVVLDVNMPELDGYGFCEKLNSMSKDYEQLPIVFLTSIESKALELLGRQFGAYLNKPVSKDKLLAAVDDLLSRTEATV